MTDIFREVDEEVRAQKMAALWRRYGTLVFIVAILIVCAVGGWRFYTYRQEQAAAESSARFEAALALARNGVQPDGQASAAKPADNQSVEASKAFAALGSDGTTGYRLLARFRAAGELSLTDAAAGAKAFDALAEDSSIDETLRDLARVRAAMHLVDTAPVDDIVKRIGALAEPGKPWRASAREVLGLARYKAGDLKGASGHFEQIVLDPETPEPLRQRAQVMIGLVRGGVVPVK